MAKAKKINSFHPDNPHQGHYDFDELLARCPALEQYMSVNPRGERTINFFEQEAVRLLNKALLQWHYGITSWDVPPGYLIPPIPGRGDYIYYLADEIDAQASDTPIRCLDVGVGANAVYCLIGAKAKKWHMVGSDISKTSLDHAATIITSNGLDKYISLRHQANPKYIFRTIIRSDEYFHATMCNPPFHRSAADALASSRRKVNNLTGRRHKNPVKNFSGQANELWVEGGERAFLQRMMTESQSYADQVGLFTTLVSKESNIRPLTHHLHDLKAAHVKMIELQTGNKRSRILTWKF